MTVDDTVPTSAGLSSFNLLDEDKFFTALALKPGMTLLDFACGVGNYAIAAVPYVGDTGRIYAVDPWEEGIETLEVRAAMARRENIHPLVCGAGADLPLSDNTVDLCIMATVLHILAQEQLIRDTMREIQRVLKPGGIVAAVEFHKIEGPPGPPLSWRLAPDELGEMLAALGFLVKETVEIGIHNYLSLFRCPR